MDDKTHIRIRKSLARGIEPKLFLMAFTAHAVIPAFSNCFFSILQPTKALICRCNDNSNQT